MEGEREECGSSTEGSEVNSRGQLMRGWAERDGRYRKERFRSYLLSRMDKISLLILFVRERNQETFLGF